MDPEASLRLKEAQDAMQALLENERRVRPANEVVHRYEDKYLVVERAADLLICSLRATLIALGMTEESFRSVAEWAEGSSISLSFRAESSVTFLRSEERILDGAEQTEHKVSGFLGVFRTKTVTRIVEYFWMFRYSYEVIAFAGSGRAKSCSLCSGSGTEMLVTRSDAPPYPLTTIYDPIDVQLSWLWAHTDGDSAISFSIDRGASGCFTPARNAQVHGTIQFAEMLMTWCDLVNAFFQDRIFAVARLPRAMALRASHVAGAYIFSPINTLLEEGKDHAEEETEETEEAEESEESTPPMAIADGERQAVPDREKHSHSSEAGLSSDGIEAPDQPRGAVDLSEFAILPVRGEDSTVLLSTADYTMLLTVHSMSMTEQLAFNATVYGEQEEPAAGSSSLSGERLLREAEGRLLVLVKHMRELCEDITTVVAYVENMIRSQLVAAIGRVLSPSDFAEYMIFHGRKLFRDDHQPTAFAHEVRETEYTPDGLLSLTPAGSDQPVVTLSRCVDDGRQGHPGPQMSMTLSGGCKMLFTGTRRVHTFIAHSFEGASPPALSLEGRARQFSCFILLAGQMVSDTEFAPKHSILLQNKDRVLLPLLLEPIPAPKAFRDAIRSLSPEQQAFAKAFRAMQLESTLFAVCVVQVRPHLERLLCLPSGSLTKEVRLTQDLMDLFIGYQIPSDILKYDGDGEASVREQVAAVKSHVVRVLEMIERKRSAEVDATRLEEANTQANEVHQIFNDVAELLHAQSECLDTTPMSAVECSSGEKGVLGGVISSLFGKAGGGATVCDGEGDYAAIEEAIMDCEDRTVEREAVKVSEARKEGMNDGSRNGVDGSADSQRGPDDLKKIGEGEGAMEYMTLPKRLDAKLEVLDTDAAVRPTIIKVDDVWERQSLPSLLSAPCNTFLGTEEQRLEANRCADLLDALTQSGAIPLPHTDLHVIVALTHSFDKTLMETVVQDNANPIEQVERTLLIAATTLHSQPARHLIRPERLPAVQAHCPSLF